MLERLSIKNFVLIDSIEINFSSELTILTGETGAGKSIIIGALGLITGSRADTKSFFDPLKKCIIEASIQIGNYDLEEFFATNDLEFEKETILRRELQSDGKSRAFINDSPVNLTLLKNLGELLIDIHSQFDTISLNKEKYQLDITDAYCKHKDLLKTHSLSVRKLNQQKKELQVLAEKSEKAGAEQDFITYQFNELDEAKLNENELSELETEAKELSHAEEILSALRRISYLIEENEYSILGSLQEAINSLSAIEKFYNPSKELLNRLKSSQIELKDIVGEIGSIESSIHSNDVRLKEVEDRISQLNSLLVKHRKQTIHELIELHSKFNQQLSEFGNMDESILLIKKNIEDTELEVLNSAEQISANRKASSPEFNKNVMSLLKQMGMPDAQFMIEITERDNKQIDSSGKDVIKFLFSSNKGFEMKELSKIASGGELSRLMLAIKYVLATVSKLPTIIFDEIDSGISGEIAQKMGGILESLAKNLQVITITHLPQIASKGETHFMVSKGIKGNQTVSTIKYLEEDERILEIAKMLSGDNPTKTALENAKELLFAN